MELKTVTPAVLEESYLSLSFPKNPTRPYVVINMVVSVDGSVTVVDSKTGLPSEKGLGSKVDQRMMRVQRFHADATLNGAETLRISGSGSSIGDQNLEEKRKSAGKKANPIACILTREAENLPLDKTSGKNGFFYSPDFEAIVFTTERASERDIEKVRQTGRAVEVLPNKPDNVKQMLSLMKSKYGIDHLLCEGGPTINGALLSNGLVDELFFTMAMKLVAGGKQPIELPTPLTRDALVEVKPVSVYYVAETNEFYLHYKLG